MLIINENCPGCGLCAQVCPLKSITLAGSRAALAGECVECGLCLSACPIGALSLGQTTAPFPERTTALEAITTANRKDVKKDE